MKRELLIPYATNAVTGEKVFAEMLAERMADPRDTVRLDATLEHDTATRQAAHFNCPECGQGVYPHAPLRPGGRYYWSHRPKSAENCPLAYGRPLSPDQINRLIFFGRQEGEAHRKLVALLRKLALADPNTRKDTLKINEYERPTPDIAAEFPHGRFPDVAFNYGEAHVVLEAQLATISLHGINGRRAYYDRLGSTLLWIMKNFDPMLPLRASVRDILADQRGLLLSIDKEAQEQSETAGVFHLQAWTFELIGGEPAWNSRVLPLAEIIKLTRPRLWSDDFKQRFTRAYDGKSYKRKDVLDPVDFLNEAMRKLGLSEYAYLDREAAQILAIMRLLISLEAGRPIGSGHPSVVSLANKFDHHDGHRYRSLVVKAIEHWQPELFERQSMQDALDRSGQRLEETREVPFGRTSTIGRLRDLLFPRWELEPVGQGKQVD